MNTEKPAKGVIGFLLWNPFDNRHFFRVYDPKDKRVFVDYSINAEDIEVKILDTSLSLYEGDKNKLDYSSKVLGKK